MSTSSATVNTALSILAPQTSTTGSSSFASDLQASVNRALEIASLPMQLVQADQATINNKSTELSKLGGLFGSLQTALQGISSGTGNGSLQATVGDSSVVSANLTGSPLQGTYTVQVLNPGTTSSAESNATTPAVTDPTSQSISSSSSFTLTVGTATFTITPGSNNLNALAAAINSSGAPAQAVVINLGGPSSPDYRLAIQSTALGDVPLQLNDGTNDLLSTLVHGTAGSYTVNGQPPGGITTNSSTVIIAPGLNVTLKAAGTTTITVASNVSAISNQLSAFVTAYNSTFAELQKNFGQAGGALTGDSSVFGMQNALRQTISYISTGGGSITSLAQLGVEFTQQGTLTFDSSVLSNLSQSQTADALKFLGDPSSSGFLQFATNTLNGINDPSTGLVANETQTLQNQSQADQTKISNDQAQLALLQTNLQKQMAQANALIATLQNENTFLQGLFQANTSNNPNARFAG
jgi:flagellar hook-associated protein 2